MSNYTNLERLNIELPDTKKLSIELDIFLLENDLDPAGTYDPTSNTDKKKIYQTALSVLESIANNTNNYKNYKSEDITVSMFQKNIQDRIDYLNRKIRTMIDDDFTSENDATFVYMF